MPAATWPVVGKEAYASEDISWVTLSSCETAPPLCYSPKTGSGLSDSLRLDAPITNSGRTIERIVRSLRAFGEQTVNSKAHDLLSATTDHK